MTAKKLLFLLFIVLCQNVLAQNDSIIGLQEVVVFDSQLRKFSTSQNVQTLNDSVIDANAPSLTSLLNYNSTIFFKENGLGMVASASFRGTTAQQTAVVWNGININSNLNGQTDFNTIPTASFDDVSVRSGGGSVLYGSSAIGGSVHLNNELRFSKKFEQKFRVDYGSFNTLRTDYEVASSSRKWSVRAGFSRNSSDNDYELPTGLKNVNGQFDNISFNAAAAYKIDQSNTLQLRSMTFNGDKNLSLLFPTDTKTAYNDFTTRNLLEWEYKNRLITSKVKTAVLTEQYRFFSNIAGDEFVRSRAETMIAKYDFSYQIQSNLTANIIADFTSTTASGDDIFERKREVSSATVLIKHQLKTIEYELGVRKEITAEYESPLLFSAGAKYQATPWYSIKLNASRNFRIPTFNDMFWIEGGNTNLRPESSYQAEIGNDVDFGFGKLSVTGYYMQISAMIQWLPGSTTVWFPRNVVKVDAYGLESAVSLDKSVGTTKFEFAGTYAYTVSKNSNTGYQLIYVPFHKATAALAFSSGALAVSWQTLLNGEMFLRSDNNPNHKIDAYSVSNISAVYRFGKKETVGVGFKILNLFDSEYEVVDNRPFPGRNYNMSLTFNL